MPDRCATSSTREASICQQCYIFIETHTSNHRCWCQHFTHTRTAFRSFVADNYNITFYDFTAYDSFNRFFFTIEYLCWTRMNKHICIYGTGFYNGTIYSKVTFKNRDTTSFMYWIIPWVNNIFIHNMSCRCNFTLCFKSNSFAICMKATIFC